MKHPYLCLFLFSGFVIQLGAQPTINSDILFQIGDQATVYYSSTDFNPGPSGADVEWDFSTLSSSYQLQWHATAPATTGFQDSFPNATIAFTIPADASAGVIEDTYAFYEEEGTNFRYLGSTLSTDFSGETQISYFTLNEDADDLYSFLLSFGQSSSDAVAGTNTINADDNTFVTQRTGTTTTEVDAYGTLHTPMGTFENTLRVKRTEDLSDDFSGISTTQEIVRYDWLSPNHKYILFHMEEIIIRDFLGNEQSRSTQTYYSEPAIINSIDDERLTAPQELHVYPNPTADWLYFDLPLTDLASELTLYIISADGRTMLQAPITAEKRELPVTALPTGQYWLEIRSTAGMIYRAAFARN